MDIKTFSDLAKIADICRKKGIKQLKISQDGIEFQMGDKPTKPGRSSNTSDRIDTPVISDEDLLFYSVTGAN